MKQIPFIHRDQKYHVLVDDIDYWSVLSLFQTTAYLTETGEVKVCKDYKHESLSNWLLGKPPAGFVIDHINRDKFDFRRENLRVVTHTVNVRNRGLFKNNRLGFKGVHWHRGKYVAQLCVGKQRFYSYHDTAEAAAYGYDSLVVKHSPESTTNVSLGLLSPKLSVSTLPTK